ncbi:MAG: restriction endonuclease [Salinimicrobium sp.]
MKKSEIQVTTASGERSAFSREKIARSLQKSGASEETVHQILDIISAEVYPGMSTKRIFKRAFKLLRKKDRLQASRYKLKKAIYELGPTGFPFERFVAAVYAHLGYKVEVGKIVQGKCVTHEIDVVAERQEDKLLIECKFHAEQGRKCNVKVPLYIASRFRDIQQLQEEPRKITNHAWIVTNTRFTTDAITYGKCSGLNLLSWDTPKDHGLKDILDQTGLYPITVSTLLTQREKQFLLNRDVVLCRDIIKDDFYLDQLEIGEERKQKILDEMLQLGSSKENRDEKES